MTLAEAFSVDMISLEFEADSSEELLRGIASLAATSPILEKVGEQQVYNALRARENLGSTACGHGIAVPHCRLAGIDGFVSGLLILKKPVDFAAGDGENIRTAAFVIGPESRPREHLRLLSSLAQTFRSREIRERIEGASSPEEVVSIISSRDNVSETPPAPVGSMLMHVFIQEEHIFDDVLQVFAATESSSAMVLIADESTRYLMDIPFFAGFWNTDVQSFNRVIVAVIRRELINATIRNIEFVCGPLSERRDIMVTVTDLTVVKGSLGG